MVTENVHTLLILFEPERLWKGLDMSVPKHVRYCQWFTCKGELMFLKFDNCNEAKININNF